MYAVARLCSPGTLVAYVTTYAMSAGPLVNPPGTTPRRPIVATYAVQYAPEGERSCARRSVRSVSL